MTARMLDGVAVANQIRAELAPAVSAFTARAGRPPGLGIVLVGDNPASAVYVRSKLKSAGDAGLRADLERLPATASLDELLTVVDHLNRSDAYDGILVQSPLPAAMGDDAERQVFDAVSPDKDVDGFHAVNVGHLVQNRATLVACTPSGVIEILERSQIPIAGARAVVIGRSDIVGKPMALLLLHANATVAICHSKTRDIAGVIRGADILVAAIGKAGYVQADWIKPGAAVIDVGTNKVSDPAEAAKLLHNFPERMEKFRAKGNVLVGDVHPDAVQVAGALSPVPGGVGPMTITMLMSNTVKAARLRRAGAAAVARS